MSVDTLNFDSESTSADDDDEEDEVSSTLRPSQSQGFINEARELAEKAKQIATENNLSPPHLSFNENNTKIDANKIADAVLSFFNQCELNPANLSDEQVRNYIKFFVEKSANAATRIDFTETQLSPDSGYNQ